MSILKGIGVVLITIALFGASVKAHAGSERELRQHLVGKTVVYQGTCHLKDGKFAETDVKDYTVHRCIVGVDMNEEGEVYYALIYGSGNQAQKLLRIDKEKKEQTVLWERDKVMT